MTVFSKGDVKLTRRLSKWLNKAAKRRRGGVVIKESRKNWGWELHLLFMINWGGGRAGEVFSSSWSLPFSILPLHFPCSVIISLIFCPWDTSSCAASMEEAQALVFFPLCSVVSLQFSKLRIPVRFGGIVPILLPNNNLCISNDIYTDTDRSVHQLIIKTWITSWYIVNVQ